MSAQERDDLDGGTLDTGPTDGELAHLRALPPDLPHPRDRFEQVRRLASRNRRRKVAGVAGAGIAVVALAFPLGSLLTGGERTSTVAAISLPSCPDSFPQRVPQGSGTAPVTDRLVPTRVPSTAVLCRYRDESGTQDAPGTSLSGSRRLTGGLERVPRDLAWLPRAQDGGTKMCTMMAGPSTHYLMALAYDDGVAWVSTVDDPNGCGDTTNGTFVSSTGAGDLAGAAYDSGSWTGVDGTADSGCDVPGTGGRLGQERAMIPDRPRRVRICSGAVPEGDTSSSGGSDGTFREITDADRVAQLSSLLNGVPASTTSPECGSAGAGDRGTGHRIRFDYAQGPSVLVRIDPSCTPQIDNGSLRASLPDEVGELVEELSRNGS